jgi:hypothetical protein
MRVVSNIGGLQTFGDHLVARLAAPAVETTGAA